MEFVRRIIPRDEANKGLAANPLSLRRDRRLKERFSKCYEKSEIDLPTAKLQQASDPTATRAMEKEGARGVMKT